MTCHDYSNHASIFRSQGSRRHLVGKGDILSSGGNPEDFKVNPDKPARYIWHEPGTLPLIETFLDEARKDRVSIFLY